MKDSWAVCQPYDGIIASLFLVLRLIFLVSAAKKIRGFHKIAKDCIACPRFLA